MIKISTWYSFRHVIAFGVILFSFALFSTPARSQAFGISTAYTTGESPRSVVVANVNDDEKKEIITANPDSDTVSAGLGDGTGSFDVSTTFAVGNTPCSVAVADFKTNGNPDWINTNSGGANVSVNCPSLTVNTPTVTTITVGAYSPVDFIWSVTGSSTYSFTFGGLPPGLSVVTEHDNYREINGTPVQIGVFPVSLTVTNGDGCSFVAPPFTITVNCPSLTVNTPTVATATVGADAFDTFIWFITGEDTYSFTFGGLPPGLSVATVADNYRAIGGRPTQTGVFPVSLTVTNAYGCSLVAPPFNITVNCPSLTVNTPTVATATVGMDLYNAFTWSITGTDTYSFTFGGLPPGLSVGTVADNYRAIGGRPTQTGVFPVSLTVTNAYGCSLVAPPFTITVNCPSLTVNTPTVATATAGIDLYNAFAWSITGAGTYSFTFGGLPPGLSVATVADNYRAIGGRPTQTGVFPVSLTVTNAYGCSLVAPPFNITINCTTMGVSSTANPATCGPTGSISFTTTLPDGSYSLSYTGSGSPKPVTVSGGTFIVANLPAGSYNSFSLSQAGTGCVLRANTTVSLANPAAMSVTAPVVTTGAAGVSFMQNFSVTNGVQPYTFTRLQGALPPGLTLTTGGSIDGIPTQTGAFAVTVLTTDANSCSALSSYSLTVNCPSLTVIGPTVTTAAVGEGVYNFDFGWFIAGTSSYSSTFSGLPPGFIVDSPGPNYWRLVGTPTQTGVFPVSLTVINEFGCSFVAPPYNLSVVVVCPSLTVTAPVVATAAVGESVPGNSFEWLITSTSNYTSAFSGLPPGLHVDSPGPNFWRLLGTPTQAGVFSVSLTVTTDYGCSFVVPPFSITVNCAIMGISTTTDPATCGATGSISFATTLPDGSYSLSYSGSGTPKPVTVSGGAFSLTGLTAGSYSSFSLSQPGLGCVLQEYATVSLTNPAAPTPVLTAGNGGTLTCARTSLTLTASGGNSYTFVRAGGGGIVSQNAAAGTAVVNMSGTYSVTVTNAAGCTSQTSIVINADNDPPSLSISPSSVTLTCASPSAVLLVVGTGDARWSTGAVSNTISVASADTYSVTLTGGNGCTSVNSATVVSATAAPALSINPSSTLISCASPAVSLSAVGTGPVRWSTGAVSAVISVSLADTYSVTLSDGGGCTAVASVVVSASLLGNAAVTAGGSLGCGVTTTTVRVQATGATSFTLLGPNGYNQTNSSGIFSVSAGGSYTGIAGQSGCVTSNTVVVAEGGAQPTISSVQAAGALGSGACRVSVQGAGYGDRYVLTGPSYVFSVVFRTVGDHAVVFPDVVKPGTYTLTVYSGNCVVTRTVAVTGTACP
nr:VCBS repeat-containing protein [uncultured Arsenicibacter sp.]